MKKKNGYEDEEPREHNYSQRRLQRMTLSGNGEVFLRKLSNNYSRTITHTEEILAELRKSGGDSVNVRLGHDSRKAIQNIASEKQLTKFECVQPDNDNEISKQF